ncbi:hypothetical protein M758_UG285200 [Ceratodon purpureus]|nr:hypothetical protein M758_UG285200 [Ceratodon purpureus]
MYSSESVGGFAFYCNDPALRDSCIRNSATSSYPMTTSFDHHNAEHCHTKLNVVVPASASANSITKDAPTSSDIRNIVRASFDRDHQQRTRAAGLTTSARENPRLSEDGSHTHQPYRKNLLRSSSVDHERDRLRLSVDTGSTPRHSPADLPRSSSVGGRSAARMLADWKDGLRSSNGSPQLTSKEKAILKQNTKHLRNPAELSSRKYQISGEGRDATRLTVELKEGPRLSFSVDDRRGVVKVNTPRPISRFRESCDLMPSSNLKDSRAADIEEFLRGSQKVGREGHRYSVDGTRDVPRACTAPRLSVDGREYSVKEGSVDAHVPRRLKLEQVGVKEEMGRDEFVRQSSGRGNVEDEGMRRKPSNVVARLMGLNELPSLKEKPLMVKVGRRMNETDLLQEFLQLGGSISPPPPPSPPDDYDYAHRSSNREVLQHWQQRVGRYEEDSRHYHFSSTHWEFITPTKVQQFEELTLKRVSSKDCVMHVEQPAEEDIRLKQKVNQPHVPRKSPQGRRSLWHIFEAMQLKGLLNGLSKKKQAEALRLHNLKLIEEKECEELKKRSQSLPPQLSSSVSKHHSGLDFQDTPRVLSLPLNRESASSRALAEHKTGSGLEQHRQATESEGHEESRVMVKPTITRSMSYKSQAAATLSPPCATVSDNLNVEDAFSKNFSRGVSKTVAYHRGAVNEIPQERLQVADSSYSHYTDSSASILRQSRKERGAARMTKSFSDVPQSDRHSIPRGFRAHENPQEKPARSSSPRGDFSSVSPRCPGSVEDMRLMDAGRMRRKQAIAVKEREETKQLLADMRANATKQEFIKGRASGDPDTPRLLRRSSSESKLLYKIAEKPIITYNPAKKPSVEGRRAALNITLLRSKRPVSKDNKLLLKTRPPSPRSVKSVANSSSSKATVAVEHVNRSKTVCTGVSESASTLAQVQQPAESKSPAVVQSTPRCSMTEVRATQGGALDHSGVTTHSNARKQITESMAREKIIGIDEGVKTPRGVSIKKIDFSEDVQAEVAEQPSPVSVLNNSHFDEELTLSPKAAKFSVVCLQKQSRNEKDRRWSSARFLDLDLEDRTTSSTALLTVPESVKEETDSAISVVDTDVTTLEKSEPALEVPVFKDSTHRHSLRICLNDADKERTYVEELVEASLLGSGCSSSDLLALFSDYVIDPIVFDQLESKRTYLDTSDNERETLDRRILFDCVNEVLERLLETQVSRMRWRGLFQPILRKRLMGRQLVNEVLFELEGISSAASEDVCDTVYVILQKDLVKGRGQWSDYNKELEEVGVVVELMIIKDLIDETVGELSACLGQNPLAAGGASKRQLFV